MAFSEVIESFALAFVAVMRIATHQRIFQVVAQIIPVFLLLEVLVIYVFQVYMLDVLKHFLFIFGRHHVLQDVE